MVSEELHFRRAAERLHMAQPPLSQAIRRLEGHLGVELLTRTGRTVALTDAGRVFAEQARELLATFNLAVAEARRVGGGDLNLQIGCTPYLPIDLLYRFLDTLQEREPRVRPQVSHLLRHEQIQRLQRGELEVGIFPGPGSVPKLQTEPIFPGEPLAAFLRPDHPLAAKAVLGPDDLADETLVTFPQAPLVPLAGWLDEEMARVGYRFRGLYATGIDARDRVLAVAEGMGLALLPGSTDVIANTAIVVRRPLDPPLVLPDTVVAWRTDPPAHLRALTEEICELARELRATTNARLINA